MSYWVVYPASLFLFCFVIFDFPGPEPLVHGNAEADTSSLGSAVLAAGGGAGPGPYIRLHFSCTWQSVIICLLHKLEIQILVLVSPSFFALCE